MNFKEGIHIAGSIASVAGIMLLLIERSINEINFGLIIAYLLGSGILLSLASILIGSYEASTSFINKNDYALNKKICYGILWILLIVIIWVVFSIASLYFKILAPQIANDFNYID